MILFHGHEAHARSVVKATSWRTLGSIDTFLLGWLFTGSAKAAGAIAGTEVITKIGLYYFHERVWSSIHWGIKRTPTLDETTLDEATLDETGAPDKIMPAA